MLLFYSKGLFFETDTHRDREEPLGVDFATVVRELVGLDCAFLSASCYLDTPNVNAQTGIPEGTSLVQPTLINDQLIILTDTKDDVSLTILTYTEDRP